MSSERQAASADNPWWGEHVHRYNVVIEKVNLRDSILDIACGTGFGSDILAQHTKQQVIGGDIAREAIAECEERWSRNNLQFKVLDGTNLPFSNGFFTKIVSFETIEHTTEYRKMLEEFERVLSNDGVAYISTPNFPVNSPSGKVTNPYHTQEFVYEELKEILETVFADVTIYGQQYARYRKSIPRRKIGKLAETLMYQRGICQLPLSVKDAIMQYLIDKPMYPIPNDYRLTDEIREIEKCKTFFAICRK